jgi:hypothetical protein
MKKHYIYFLLIMVFGSINTTNAAKKASVTRDTSNTTILTTVDILQQDANAMSLRLIEIKAMDKSIMSPAEKKALRKEVRAINNAQVKNGGGVYLSVGAIIVILLLLIILL